MKKNEILEIAVKILGLTLVPSFIREIGQIIFMAPMYSLDGFKSAFNNGASIFFIVMSVICYLLPLYLFLFRSSAVVRMITKKEHVDENITLGFSRSEYIEIAIIITGGVALVETVPAFFYYAYSYIQVRNIGLPDEVDTNNRYFFLDLISVVVSVILMAYAKTISLIFSKKDVKDISENSENNTTI